jgi:5'-3' exonuclease
MGVPSYFSYIIKNHSTIIKKLNEFRIKNNTSFGRLYMDCNSILYDSYREIENKNIVSLEEFENEILNITKNKIEKYIEKINPEDVVYIAFDGVAPFAKMEQQRNRRYKGAFQKYMLVSNDQEKNDIFTTSMFTPGTKFMKKLSLYMMEHFQNRVSSCQIIIATPNEAGEGEHKLYEHLRQFPEKNKKIAIYGLDADLIMLSLFHLSYCENIYVFREAPEFMKNALTTNNNGKYSPTDLWFLDIAQLGRSIASEMDCSFPDNHRMYDYVFLCFFLGNDFLPHFPALNIRTNGIQRLLDTYRMCIGNQPECFLLSRSTPPQIQWKEVSRLIHSLARNEHSFILQEHAVRKKWDYRRPETFPQTTPKEKEELFQSVPILFRGEEKYIQPNENGWEMRYYHRLFQFEYSEILPQRKKEISLNYLEGLEWVCKYYTSGCPDWYWKYEYMYPPLLVDLAPFVPQKKMDLISTTKNMSLKKPFSPEVQLAYVLPVNQLHLLPDRVREILLSKYNSFYPEIKHLQFKWAYCRYLWESHILLPEIKLKTLLDWEKTFAK